ncbi:MAG: CpsD/CapB family tyrosine-protein kinase [Lachnospiraceae bacterium]|nr:CpsD/CapB family tyrosine-protein kinase [Lachnospiraceae bacterium]
MDKLILTDTDELSFREKDLYRTLRTNIEFTGIENKAIILTSCYAGDGKSTVTYNLAVSMAESGKNVLLIDADLRRSVFAKLHQVEGNPRGLSHYLAGRASLQEVIYSTNKKRLFLIPVGVFPSNPTELLGNGRLEKGIEVLKGTFDYILIDTAPLGEVIDAAVVAKYADASIMVVSANTTSKTAFRSTLNQLKIANPNFLGAVLDRVEVSRGSYYGKKYGYYGKYGYYSKYGYQHGYGEENLEDAGGDAKKNADAGVTLKTGGVSHGK